MGNRWQRSGRDVDTWETTFPVAVSRRRFTLLGRRRCRRRPHTLYVNDSGTKLSNVMISEMLEPARLKHLLKSS